MNYIVGMSVKHKGTKTTVSSVLSTGALILATGSVVWSDEVEPIGLTDEQLAAQYREKRAEVVAIVDELGKRGYNFFNADNGDKILYRPAGIAIRKTETITKEI